MIKMTVTRCDQCPWCWGYTPDGQDAFPAAVEGPILPGEEWRWRCELGRYRPWPKDDPVELGARRDREPPAECPLPLTLQRTNAPACEVYYLDPENGSDLNDGTTPEKAWKTTTAIPPIKKTVVYLIGHAAKNKETAMTTDPMRLATATINHNDPDKGRLAIWLQLDADGYYRWYDAESGAAEQHDKTIALAIEAARLMWGAPEWGIDLEWSAGYDAAAFDAEAAKRRSERE